MSRTNSAPNSPVIGGLARTGSPRINRSFRGEKDIGVGELTNRMRKLKPDGFKNRRDDRESDESLPSSPATSRKLESSGGGCCGGHEMVKSSTNSLGIPNSPRARSKSPGINRGQLGSPSLKRPTSLMTSMSQSLGQTSTNSLSIPNSPRNRSKSPGGGRGQPASPSMKRPTSLLPSGPNPTLRRSPSPRSPASPSASLRASPARTGSARGLSPNKHLRSPATPTKSLPAELLDPEVLARVGNRAIKTVSKPARLCDHCRVALTDDGCTAFGKVFHKECFRCTGCKKKLDGKFFSKDDNAYCAKCHKAGQEQCCVCKQKIVGDCVVNNDTFYHPDCMKCHICDEALKGSYFFYKNKPICEKDFKEIQQICSICGEVIEGTYYTQNDEIICEKDYMAHMDKCSKCDKAIEAHGIRTSGCVFHPDCFTCEVCGTKLEDKTFSMDKENRIYCPEDYTKKFAALCSVCTKPIVPKEGQTKAPRIRAMDRDFHPSCFKCEDCSLVLDSGIKGKECWPIRHHVLCYKCNRRRQSESESESD